MDSSIEDAIVKAKTQASRLPAIINARKLTMSDLESSSLDVESWLQVDNTVCVSELWNLSEADEARLRNKLAGGRVSGTRHKVSVLKVQEGAIWLELAAITLAMAIGFLALEMELLK